MYEQSHNFSNVSLKPTEANRLARRLFQLEARVAELELKSHELYEMLNFIMIKEMFGNEEEWNDKWNDDFCTCDEDQD